MQLKLGSYRLSVTRARGSSDAERIDTPPDIAFSAYPVPTRYYYNNYDAPRLNLLFVRETVSACMHARSEAISNGVFRLYRSTNTPRTGAVGSPNAAEQVLHHPVAGLLKAPNPLLDMSDLLELTSQWLDATGNALLLKVRDNTGVVRELWPLPALNFDIQRGNDGLPEYYRFQPTNTLVPREDILHIRRPDLRTAPLYGHAILSDILDTAKADTAVRLFQERYFANDAVPRSVLRWPAGALLSQEQMDEIRDRWTEKYGGPGNAGKMAILPDGGEIQVLSGQSKELDFRNAKEDLSDAIRQAFKVPKIVLGEVDNVNLANAETSYQVFLRDVVEKTLARIAREFTRELAHEYGDAYYVQHDSVMPDSESEMLARLDKVKQSLSIDEQRALLGLAPLENGQGNVFVIGTQIFTANWQPL